MRAELVAQAQSEPQACDTSTPTEDAEVWDVLDVDGSPTGRVVARNADGGDPEAYLRAGEFHRIVMVVVFDPVGDDPAVLIQQRSAAKAICPGLWDLTAGGSALAGETSQQAASRELAEEVGLLVDFSRQSPHISLTRPTAFLDIYLVDLPGIDPARLVLQTEEVQAVRWSTRQEILTLMDQGQFCPFHPSLVDLIFDVRRCPGELSR
ncbi:MAG: NUDIX domain-containing protein [Propionibacteriaceae bacterium]|nr:NUDIX domain-containing protein [Propionibacteriaceae bacterium]